MPIAVLQNPFRVPAEIVRFPGLHDGVWQPWAALRNAFGVEFTFLQAAIGNLLRKSLAQN